MMTGGQEPEDRSNPGPSCTCTVEQDGARVEWQMPNFRHLLRPDLDFDPGTKMDAEDNEAQMVDFPQYSTTFLEHLNRHRMERKFCDIHIHVQQCSFQAHKAVLAASSPYFHDQLLLKDSGTLLLPDLLDPVIFERVLVSAYTGRLFLSLEDIGSYLTVASFLQMWHVVDKCNEFIRRGCHITRAQSSRSSDTQSPSSSNFFSSSKDVGDTWLSDQSRSCVSVREDIETEPEHFQKPVEEKYFSVRASCVSEKARACTFSGVTSSQKHTAQSIKREGIVRDQMSDGVEKEVPLMLGGAIDQMDQFLNIAETQALASIDFIGETGESHSVQVPCYGPTDPGNLSSEGDAADRMAMAHRPLGHSLHAPVDHTSRFGKKVFGCLCGKRFPEKGRRDRHVLLRISMRPFACNLCNKKFKLKHHLGEHMLVHMDRPLHNCGTCGKKFKLYECFLRHQENCEKLNSISESTIKEVPKLAAEAGQRGCQGYV